MDSFTEKIDTILSILPSFVLDSIDVMCYGYILSKSLSFLSSDSKSFSELDAFREPFGLSADELKRLRKNCLQLTEGKGVSDDKPILIKSVSEIYKMLDLFHFKVNHRKSNYSNDGIIDRITISHSLLLKNNSDQNMTMDLFFKIQRPRRK